MVPSEIQLGFSGACVERHLVRITGAPKRDQRRRSGRRAQRPRRAAYRAHEAQ
jgi:hypothetical protein